MPYRFLHTHATWDVLAGLFLGGDHQKISAEIDDGEFLLDEFLAHCSLWELAVVNRRFNHRTFTERVFFLRMVDHATRRSNSRSDEPATDPTEQDWDEEEKKFDPNLPLADAERAESLNVAELVFKSLPEDVRAKRRTSAMNEMSDRVKMTPNGLSFLEFYNQQISHTRVRSWHDLLAAARFFDELIKQEIPPSDS